MNSSPRFNFGLLFLALTVLCVLPFGHVWADEARQLELNRFYWSNGRGLLQHYHSIQSGPWTWSGNLNEARVELPQNFESCHGVTKATDDVFDQCASLAVLEIGRFISNQQKVSPEVIERMKIFAAVFENQNQTYKWQSWLRLSSASILAGEYRFANQMLNNAKKSDSFRKSQDIWVRHRLSIFDSGLQTLINEKKTYEHIDNIRKISPKADTGSVFLAKEVVRLNQGKVNPNPQSDSDRNPDEILNELARQRWVLRQDRDELVNIRSLLSESGFGVEVLRRMNSLLSQHQFRSREWQAIVSVIASVAAKVEYLDRNQGLSLALEQWLGNREKQGSFLSYDDDSFLLRQHHIQQELTRTIAGVVELMSAQLALPVERKQAELILERLQGMSSTAGASLGRLPVSEVQQQAMLLKSQIHQLDEALRRLQAMVAAVDFVRLSEQDSLQAIVANLSEIGTLRNERMKIFFEFVSQTVSLIPHTMTSITLLNQKTDYLRRTLSDVRTLVAGQKRQSLEGTQAGFFFSEANQLLDRISIESRQYVARKSSEAARVASGFKSIDAGVASLRGDLGKLMAESSTQLRLPLTKILSTLELELHKQERSLELKEQLAHAENKRRISIDKAKLEWQRDRVGDSRRIRSENLEWRSGR